MSHPATQPSKNAAHNTVLLGIVLMLVGVFLYTLNDVMGKWLVATYSVGQVLLIRSAAALVLLTPFLIKAGPAPFLSAPRPWLQVTRVVLGSLEVGLFYWAVAYLPLADVVTYYLAGPIYVTALSPFLLGEKVGWRRWCAVLVGFIGVIIALNPSTATLSWPALIAITGSVTYALMLITTRMLRGTHDTVMVSTQIATTFVLGALTAGFGWVTPSLRDVALFVLLGAVAMSAYVCVVRSLKLAPASVVVPYQYTMIVWAALFGYIAFGDIPGPHVLIGASIIVAAGLFIFFREQMLGRRAPAVEPPA